MDWRETIHCNMFLTIFQECWPTCYSWKTVKTTFQSRGQDLNYFSNFIYPGSQRLTHTVSLPCFNCIKSSISKLVSWHVFNANTANESLTVQVRFGSTSFLNVWTDSKAFLVEQYKWVQQVVLKGWLDHQYCAKKHEEWYMFSF